MSEHNGTERNGADRNGSDGEHRRHRLDELFADQPYLSATMKARLIHERIRVQNEGQERASRDAEAAAELLMRAQDVVPPDDAISLTDAPTYLTASPAALRAWTAEGRITPACAARLIRFRDGALLTWRRGLP